MRGGGVIASAAGNDEVKKQRVVSTPWTVDAQLPSKGGFSLLRLLFLLFFDEVSMSSGDRDGSEDAIRSEGGGRGGRTK